MTNIIIKVVKKGKEEEIKKNKGKKEEIKKKERLKYWFMPEDEKDKIRQSLDRYYRMKSR